MSQIAGPKITDDSPDGSTDWASIVIAVYLGVLAAVHIGKIAPALPSISLELGMGMTDAGFVVSVFSVVGMFGALAFGVVTDKIGARTATGAGLGCLALGGILGALSGTYATLLLSRAIEGVGFLLIVVSAPGIVANLANNQDRPMAMGMWGSFMPVGFATGVCLAAFALHVSEWRVAWGGLALLVILSAALLLPRLSGRSDSVQAVTDRAPSSAFTDPQVWFLSLAFGTYAFQWMTLMVWLPSFFGDELGLRAPTAALSTALIVAVNIPGNLLGGAMLRAGWQPVVLVGLCATAMVICATFIFTSPFESAILVLAASAAFSFFGGSIPATLFAVIASQKSTSRGAANGMLMQGSAFGQFAGPPVVGAIVGMSSNDWSAAVIPLVVAAILTAGLVALGSNSASATASNKPNEK